ncbi:L-amino-acid oxidase [Bienertia sinuspersici]
MHVQKLARRQSVTLNLVPSELGTFLNTVKRMVEALHSQIEDILRSWASCLPTVGHKKSSFGEQMNGMTVILKTKYKNYMQALVAKLYSNMQAKRNTQLKRILEETKDSDSEPEVRERMLMLNSQLIDSISNLHYVFMTQIFVALCRGFWDRLGQRVFKIFRGPERESCLVQGSYYALGILDDTFGSQMQRLQGNVLQEKDIEPPRSVVEARSMLM